MQHQLNCLREFHNAIAKHSPNQAIGKHFEAGDAAAELRARLINEEAHELCVALSAETEAAALKEACDLLYVVLGTAAAYNWPITEAFNRVHENNMLKIKNATFKNGKLIKAHDHPKVDLKDLVNGKA